MRKPSLFENNKLQMSCLQGEGECALPSSVEHAARRFLLMSSYKCNQGGESPNNDVCSRPDD